MSGGDEESKASAMSYRRCLTGDVLQAITIASASKEQGAGFFDAGCLCVCVSRKITL